MKTTGVFYYPPLINEQALYVGGMRDITNAYICAVNPEFARPNLQVDQLGCKCELIAQYFFWSHKYKYNAGQMLGGRPMHDFDIQVNAMKIDVKGIWSYGFNARVNYKAHNKDKNVTHYMFIRPDSEDLMCDVAQWWLYSHEEVDQWEVKELKYTKAYQKELL
jgi:tRNA nucleotidyltransferase/poly(A) polymerase